MQVRENLKRGTVEMILLHLLQERDMYGYELLQEMNERSKGKFTLKDGSMYPIMYRMILYHLFSIITIGFADPFGWALHFIIGAFDALLLILPVLYHYFKYNTRINP